MDYNIKFVIIMILLLFIMYLLIRKPDEKFTVYDEIGLFPKVGTFNDKYLIDTVPNISMKDCKRLCNSLDNCIGVSYATLGDKKCKLYNNAADFRSIQLYLSFRKFKDDDYFL